MKLKEVPRRIRGPAAVKCSHDRRVGIRRETVAVFGVGAFYDGSRDVSLSFIEQGIACVGWSEQDAPALHSLLRRIQTGDIVYIKAHPPGRELIVKGVGVVTDDVVRDYGDLGRGVHVRWVWRGNEVFPEAENERYNVRNNTLYEEMSPAVKTSVLNLLLGMIPT
jgi:hypothetical protein